MKTCTNKDCQMSGIPNNANFCPKCGTQLTNGNYKVVDVSKFPDLHIRTSIGKIVTTIQNDTVSVLWSLIEGLYRYKLYSGEPDILDNAKFCPNYDAPLACRGASYMSVSKCHFNPNVINAGETCKLEWKGERVRVIIIDGAVFNSKRDIILVPEQSHEYRIEFIGEDDNKISKTVNVMVRNPFIFGKDGKLMSDGSFKIDLRQVHRQVGAYYLHEAQWKWDVITGTRLVKAYVAVDEKLEFVFNSNGYLREINFYPHGKFISDKKDCYDSIMQIPYGEIKSIKEGWFVNDEYWDRTQFNACYAQYGVENMTAEQWWKEHDLTFFKYCEKYKTIIDGAIGISDNFIDNKAWESRGHDRWEGWWRY